MPSIRYTSLYGDFFVSLDEAVRRARLHTKVRADGRLVRFLINSIWNTSTICSLSTFTERKF